MPRQYLDGWYHCVMDGQHWRHSPALLGPASQFILCAVAARSMMRLPGRSPVGKPTVVKRSSALLDGTRPMGCQVRSGCHVCKTCMVSFVLPTNMPWVTSLLCVFTSQVWSFTKKEANDYLTLNDV